MDNATGRPAPERKARPRRPDSLAAEAAFRQRLKELGAELLEPEWLGAQQKHRVRCREGHACCPKPASVQQGQGICRTCVGQDPAVAEAAFVARLAELGAEMLGPYTNRRTKVHCRCAAGHDCYPNPGPVMAGGGICRTCVGADPAVAEAEFRARLVALGAQLLEPYINSATPHRVRCTSGHDCRPRPSDVKQGHGICGICAGKSPEVAEAAFRARLAELGATYLEPAWLGVDAPHRVQCPQGHIGRPRPTHVFRGGGVCNICAHNGEWDAFYVVTSPDMVKFGITANDPRPRLRAHMRDGLTEVHRLALGLPGATAREIENAVRAALALAGEKPVRGREYFDRSCLALILDIADSWLPSVTAAAGPAASIDTTEAACEWVQHTLFAA